MTTNSAELKPLPCPFCGSEPSVVSWGKDKRTGAPFHQIECCECGCSLGYSPDPLKQHIERWNSRRTAAQGEQSKEVGYTYASQQATKCAGCGKHKHTPLRIDAMGGYVCLTCIDKKLGALLGEFGYEQAGSAEQVSKRDDRAFYKAWDDYYQHAQYKDDFLAFEYGWKAALSAPERKVMTDEQIAQIWAAQRKYHGGEPCRVSHIEFARALLNQKGEQTAPEGAKP